jgi:transmembrane protein TMEM260 (protein O-mannosyltransferase)
MAHLSPRTLLVERGGLIALAALITYVWLAPTYIVDGDGAEFATLGTVGGVAHPTGYPAYLLWLRAMSWLPGVSPAHTTAIATAILAGIQLVVLHAACRAWGARATAATFAVAIYAAGPVAMRYSSQAEVFALNQLVVATVLYVAARGGPLRGGLRIAALGLVAGIGLADHMTCVLVAPVGILGVVRGVREARRKAAAAAVGVAALVVGVAPYAYLLLTRENAVSWNTLEGAGDLIDHVLRRAYGGPGAFSPGAAGRLDVAANLAAFAASVGRGWCWIPALGGVAMLGVRCVRPGGAEARIGWQMLALAFVLAGPGLAARFDIAPTGLGLYAIRRFHLLPTLILAPAVACAFEVVVARYQARLRPGVAAAIAVLGFATAALTALPELLRVRTPAVEHAMRGLLRGLPTGAVVLGFGDIPYFGTGYLQVACGERPDVVYVFWRSVMIHWYRDRLARRGIVVDTTGAGTPSVRFAEQILASGRPLFVDLSLGNVLAAFPSYPYGTLFRVLPRGQARPSLDEIAAINRDWFAALDLDYPHPGLDDEYPTFIHDGYAATWQIIADGYTGLGRPAAAASALRRMNELTPWP